MLKMGPLGEGQDDYKAGRKGISLQPENVENKEE